ncbi:MAG: GDSL-type esterase/lipase family protein [Verrucomicrobia bacterium]|nr:GDSL-type esterase/lipase family protein [Verrucomicrobiota bacterium]MDA1087865.1 GDSL-type esterase/lipase family protein [Verrucomicrobiota bacterium]
MTLFISNLAARLTFAFVVLAAGAAALEVGVRSFGPVEHSILFEPLAAHIRGTSAGKFLDLIVDDPVLFWRLAPDQRLPNDAHPFKGVISNAQGLREDHLIPRRKPSDEIRILFVGDSCTFGLGSVHTNDFVEMVEAALRERYPGIPTECVNAGVPGYTIYQGWQWLLRDGFDYDPDLVLFAFGWNDAKPWVGLSDLKYFQRMQASGPPPGLRWSRVARRIWRSLHPLELPDGKPEARVPPDEFRWILGEVDAACRKRGIDFMPILWCYYDNLAMYEDPVNIRPIQNVMHDFARDRTFGPDKTTGSVDLVAAFQEAILTTQRSHLYLDRGCHMRTSGNRVVADAVLAKIEPWYRDRIRARPE